MTIGDIRTQANDLARADMTLPELAAIANRGLLELAPVMSITAVWKKDGWAVGTSSYPGPTDAIEVGVYAWWTDVSGVRTRRTRVPYDSEDDGWWYDGTNIGLRPAPLTTGTLEVAYTRYPKLFTGADPMEEPEGGPMVAAALVQFCVSEYYARLGDAESARLADRFKREYERLWTMIASVRRRGAPIGPTSFAAGGDW